MNHLTYYQNLFIHNTPYPNLNLIQSGAGYIFKTYTIKAKTPQELKQKWKELIQQETIRVLNENIKSEPR